ncbi:MAG TPA: cytochrome P450 [Candidatus Acidoferrales bacterium]|jgi:cytochrome P450|nr:cytochrome P450 [Candidatus Acidoferrales bacterium]
MTNNGTHAPPGPKGLPVLGLALDVRKDPLGTLQRLAREYGDVVSMPVMGTSRVLVNRPDYIQQLLVLDHAKLHKSVLTKLVVGPLLGQGLLISEGDFWRRQRRLAQPAFHRSRTNEYSPVMVECALEHIHNWHAGETRNIAEEMMKLTLEVAVRTLFGTSLAGDSVAIGKAMTFLMRHYLRRARTPWRVPESWPTPANRRARREVEYMDSLIYRIISDRKKDTQPRNDLLSLLMSAMHEDGSQMTERQVRDESMTLFVAGHETTALSLAWSWYLLGENPAAEARLHDELRVVLAGRPAEVSDLEKLPFLNAVVHESLRLYPPAYMMARMNVEAVTLGGCEIPPRTTLLASQWVMHRDARFFDQPERFSPERWLDGLEARLPPGAYFPFGDGPRRCIGQGFAQLETSLVIAAIAQKFRFRLKKGFPVVPEPLVTLRPKYGIEMVIESR